MPRLMLLVEHVKTAATGCLSLVKVGRSGKTLLFFLASQERKLAKVIKCFVLFKLFCSNLDLGD